MPCASASQGTLTCRCAACRGREMREMRYLWQQPDRLGNTKLVAFPGAEPHAVHAPWDLGPRPRLRFVTTQAPTGGKPASWRPRWDVVPAHPRRLINE